MSAMQTIERRGTVGDAIELKVGFRELLLIHRSLQAVRTFGLVARQDELLADTLQLVDVALEESR